MSTTGPVSRPVSSSGEQRELNLPLFEERQSLRHQVAHALRAALVAGEMRPGMVYSAPALAEQFGVSATPVREAMLDLAKEGLVKAVRNKGFRVTELSERDLDEITQVRLLIEVPTVADIAARCHGDLRPEVEALRPLARDIERHARESDLIGYIEADRRFHLQLLSLAGNQHLVDVVSTLRARSRLYGLQDLAAQGILKDWTGEHEHLVDLVLAGDPDEAASYMRQHIAQVRGVWAADPGDTRPSE